MFQIKVAQWNCFKLTTVRIIELKNFLNIIKPDIISIQELKLGEEEANLRLRVNGYITYVKARKTNPNRGGGVAILIRSEIPHTSITGIDESLEIIGLKVETNEVCFDFVSLYNPPGRIIPYDLFSKYDSNGVDLILVGDLNSKTKSIGCKSEDASGQVLEKILSETSIVILNDNQPTYHKFKNEYTEKLDLALSSVNIANKISNFEVLHELNMESDHSPIIFNLNLTKSFRKLIESERFRLNLSRADWTMFRNQLELIASNTSSNHIQEMGIDQLNDLVLKHLTDAVERSVPRVKLIEGQISLPKEIVELIKFKRTIRKELRSRKFDTNLKALYNNITTNIKNLILEHKTKTWDKFLGKLGSFPVSSSLFWKKINEARSAKKSDVFPTLTHKNQEFKSVEDKVGIFSNLLGETFSETGSESDFDQTFKLEAGKVVQEFSLEGDDFVPFSSSEIYLTIKNIKNNTSPGEDLIQNIFLKEIPYEYIKKILSVLVNRSINCGIPKSWKSAKIKMIPKKDGMSKDPEKYRPISLTSCLGKLIERLVRARLYSLLEGQNFISKQQSGFRSNKGAGDNLLFFTQKISESINKGKKTVGIFFDISKAFDKVWHVGLLYKLIKLKLPIYLIKHLKDFLADRNFRVNIDNSFSKLCKIECSVPQGSVLGPLLFLIYINDIPLADEKHISYSSLFADDLATMFFFKKQGHVNNRIKIYLESLVDWLFKWRLKMNASKCCYTIFSSSGNRSKIKFVCNLKDGLIPYNPNPLFLGITFDEYLNFKCHTDNLRLRAIKRLNIIKIFSHKSWKLSHETLKCIYGALIGSLFTYSFFSVARIATSNLERLQRVQNRALRCIYRLDWCSSVDTIHDLSNLPLVRDRLIDLGKRHLAKAVINNPYVFLLLSEYLESKSSIRRGEVDTPLCLFY